MAVTYTNSPLAQVKILSPNCSSRTQKDFGNTSGKIDRITIHHMACNGTIEAIGRGFADPNRGGSSNYGIGSDGRIALYVEEKDRAWTSSSGYNDCRAVTIEVANDGGDPNWHVGDTAIKSLIALCVDICKRNGIKQLNYTGDANGNLTRHNMFAATTCPGPYLQSKFPYIAQEVNKQLVTPTPAPTTSKTYATVVDLKGYTTAADALAGKSAKTTLKAGTYYIYKTSGKAYNLSKTANAAGAWVNTALNVKPAAKPVTPAPATKPATPAAPKLPGYTGTITFQSYANGQWLSEILSTNVGGTGTNSYSGWIGYPISGLRAKAQYGTITIQSHLKGGDWLGKMSKYEKNGMAGSGYSGIMGKPIDAIKIWSETGHVDFRVHLKGGGWLDWIDSRNCNGTGSNSYAGIFGREIDAIQMK